MADDEKKAIEFLKTTAKNAAKGLAEESEVYRVAENIVNDNKYLFGTVNTIFNKDNVLKNSSLPNSKKVKMTKLIEKELEDKRYFG